MRVPARDRATVVGVLWWGLVVVAVLNYLRFEDAGTIIGSQCIVIAMLLDR